MRSDFSKSVPIYPEKTEHRNGTPRARKEIGTLFRSDFCSDLPAKCSDLGSEKARLSKDPRFAQWASMDLGPLADPVDPVAERAILERRELFRLAGVNALARSRNGRDLDPQARADALHWAAYPPLQGPMGNGEPV